MSHAQHVLTMRPSVLLGGPRRPLGRHRLPGADLMWGTAFVMPYAGVFVAFVVWPMAVALRMASAPALYADLLHDPLYLPTLINTLLFVGVGVNLQMFLALLLSGLFMLRRWWIRPLLVIFVLPWFLATVQACISFHWMLIGEAGLVDRLLSVVFGIDGPYWFNHRWLGISANIIAYSWKWLPFWTLIFLAGRQAMPRDIADAAAVDGATGVRRFIHITLPMLANLYVVCTLLSTIWTVGDFATVAFVSGGGPANATEVLATLGFSYAFDVGNPALGVAAAVSILPLLVPVVILLMRRLQTSEVQL